MFGYWRDKLGLVMMAATEPLAKWAIRNIGPPEIFALVFFAGSGVLCRRAYHLERLAFGSSGADGGHHWSGSGRRGLSAIILALRIWQLVLPLSLLFWAFLLCLKFLYRQRKKVTGKYDAPPVGMSFPTILELWRYKIAVIRSILVGFFCGILPGIGATLAAFMGYGEAVRWSKDKKSFGKGNMEGVISSETANNAATGAAMIPLLALGLPGGALTAMMVAVFQMHDLEPGPLVFYNSPDLIWIVFAAMFYANLSILIIGVMETKTIMYLLKIPFQFLAPMILLLASIGSYIGRGLVLDVVVMFVAGILGFLLRRSGYSIPGIVLGIILGKIGEQNFAQGMQMVHYDIFAYLSRPICSLLILAGILTLGFSIYQAFQGIKQKSSAS